MRPDVLGLDNYSDQTVVGNAALWNDFVLSNTWGKDAPKLVHLELEKIVRYPLSRDLGNKDSLVYRMLFDTVLRDAIIQSLDGIYGCWRKGNLDALLNPNLSKEERTEKLRGAYTMFFWGVDKEEGKSFPLNLVSIEDKLYLKRVDDVSSEKTFEIPFTPESLFIELQKGTIIPSLLTDFAVLAISRGFNCLGGPRQVEYLTAMIRRFLTALVDTGDEEYRELGRKIKQVPTYGYTGLELVSVRYPQGNIVIGKPGEPNTKTAGAIEIAANGGLTPDHLEEIRKTNL